MNLSRLLRFGLVGVVNTGVYLALYLTLRLAIPYLVAHVCAFALATVGSYFLNCRFTFQTKPSWRSFWLFPLATATNFAISTVGLFVLVAHVGLDQRWAALAAAALAVPVTFLVAQLTITGAGPHAALSRPVE